MHVSKQFEVGVNVFSASSMILIGKFLPPMVSFSDLCRARAKQRAALVFSLESGYFRPWMCAAGASEA